MRTKTAAIITVRMTSSRMPGKSMAIVAGKPSLQHVIERMQHSKLLDEIIVATTINQADEPIVRLCDDLAVHYFRGSEEDVLGRILEAADTYKVDNILYICGDCTCSDPKLADELLEFFLAGDLDYASNCYEITYPIGQNLEVFTWEAIRRLDRMTQDPWDREHVTEYFYTHLETFKCDFLRAPRELERPNYRLCIDLPPDHEMMCKLFDALYKPEEAFSTEDIVSFLDAHPEIVKINQMLKYKKYYCAVIGLGRSGMRYDMEARDDIIRTHSGGYTKLSRTKLDCVTELDEKASERFKKTYSIANVFKDMDVLLQKRNPEIVSICTPTALHHDQVIKAARHPSVRAVFCEKPLTTNSAQAEQMIAVCREENVLLVVNYWMRYSDIYRNLLSYLKEGRLGDIQNVLYTYSKGLLNSGSHAINLMQYFWGKPKWVQAGESYEVGTGDNNIDGMICFKNDVMVHLSCCDWRKHFTTDQQFYGTAGMVRIEENGNRLSLYHVKESPRFTGMPELKPFANVPFEHPLGKPMLTALEEIVAWLDEEIEVCSSPGEEDLMTLKVIEALKHSCQNNGQRVNII